MRARVLVPFFVAASCAALAGIGDGFGALGDNGGFAGAAGLGAPAAGGVPPPAPTFDLQAGATTPNDLSDALTVNSVAMDLVLACDAQGVSGTSWTCRDANGAVTLSEAGTGSSPTSSTLSPFKALDSAERATAYASSGKRHDAASSSAFDLTTEDIAIEVVGKMSATSGAVILDKGLAGTDGWRIVQNGTTAVNVSLRTASTTTTTFGPTIGASTWHHSMFFVDRSEASTSGSVIYTNGTAGSGNNMSARSATLTNASTFAVGAASAGSSGAAVVTSFRIWKCSACFSGASNLTQWAPIARARTAVAFGVDPTVAAGTRGPTTLTRATTAHVDVVDGSTRQLYLVAQGAPRVARRTHSAGTVVAGYLSEPAASNIALQSQTLGTTWTAITAGDNVLADAFAGADLSVTGDNIDGNNSNAEHGLRQAITVTAATHTFSAWAKTGSQNFVALRNATVADGAAWFDVATCTSSSCVVGEDCAAAVDTVQAGVSRASAERYPVDTTGDGVADVDLCRVSISYTGTAASHNHDLLCAPSDGVLTYTDADATADCGFWGVRVEAYPAPTSYLATTTAATARNADDVRYDAASHYTGDPTTLMASTLCPSYTTATTVNVVGIGSSATNYFGHRIFGTTPDRPSFLGVVTTTQWNGDGSSGDVTDGVLHNIRTTATTNSIAGYFDATSVFTDTVATLPTTASTSIVLGAVYPASGSGAGACLLPRVRVFSSIVTPAVVP